MSREPPRAAGPSAPPSALGTRLAFILFAAAVAAGSACSVDRAGLGSTGRAGAAGSAGIGAGALGGSVGSIAGAGGSSGGASGSGGLAAAGSEADAGGHAAGGGPAGATGDGDPTGTARAGGITGTAGGVDAAGSGGSAGAGDTGGAVGSGGSAGTGDTAGAPGSGGSAGTGGTGGRDCGAIACPACTRCANGACMLDPGSLWKVRCLSAAIAATKPNGDPWDAFTTATNAAPDPFCQLSLGQSVAAKTSILANTFMPAWNESLTPQSPLAASLLGSQAAPWSIQVVDDDGSTQGTDPICSVSPTLTATAFSTGLVTFTNAGSCTSLSIGLECASP